MKIKFILFFFIYFFILNNTAYSFTDQIKIELDPHNFGKYQKRIFRAYVSDGDHIEKKYKKWFNGFILTKDKKLKVKLRITGDWKDHLKPLLRKNIHVYSSLVIKVIEDNFEGRTRFKILLPRTRYGNDHIFWNNLLNYYGYTTLKMNLVKVSLNDISYNGFIEELPTKEFLESNLEREAPIIEFDERIVWRDKKNLVEIKKFIKNKQVKKFDNPYYIEANSPKIINKQYLKNFQSIKIASDAIYLFSLINFEDYIDNSKFFWNITKKYAGHGLKLFQRNFFYQPYKYKLFEIYKEGDVRLGGDNIKIEECNLNQIDKTEINIFIKKYDLRFDITNKMICAFYDVKSTYEKNKLIKNKPILNITSKKHKSFEELIKKIKIYIKKNELPKKDFSDEHLIQKYSLMYENKPYMCEYATIHEKVIGCEELMLNNYRNILSGDGEEYKSGNFILFPINLGNLSYKNNTTILKINNNTQFYDLTKDSTYILKFTGNENLKNVYFNFYNDNARLVIEGIINDFNLNFINKNGKISKEVIDNINKGRFNDKSLTGCVTLFNVVFKNTNLNAENFMCEDSINILNSSGKINKINITNSLFDALDIDFSDLSINQILVNKAENDCLDFSAGTYNILKSELNYCGDKGISVGEKSVVKLNNAKIKYSNLAVASKDSSTISIENLDIDTTKVCLSAYKKKQEFSESELKVTNLRCVNYFKKIDKDTKSKITIVKNNL